MSVTRDSPPPADPLPATERVPTGHIGVLQAGAPAVPAASAAAPEPA